MSEQRPTIGELFEDGRAIDDGLREPARDARRLHKALGRLMATWENGEVVWVQLKEIEIDMPEADDDADPQE